MYGDHFEANFMPAQLDGGLGLNDIRSIQDAQLIRTWFAVLNGPNCQAKIAMRQHEREHNTRSSGIKLPETSPWQPFLSALSRQKLKINTTQAAPLNDARREQAVAAFQNLDDWPRAQSILTKTIPDLALLPATELYHILEQYHRNGSQELAALAPRPSTARRPPPQLFPRARNHAHTPR
jgi:hypothetical protein